VLSAIFERCFLDYDKKSLNVSLGDGDVELRSVKLRSELVDSFGNGAFALLSGSVDSIKLHIPWTNIGKEATSCVVSGVVLVVATSEERVTQTSILDDTDVVTNLKTALAETLDPNSLLAQYATKIIANLQLRIDRISIRVVNRHSSLLSSYGGSDSSRALDSNNASNDVRCCGFGIVCQALSVTSVNAQWKEAVALPSDKTFYKLADLKNMAIYYFDEQQLMSTSEQLAQTTRDALQVGVVSLVYVPFRRFVSDLIVASSNRCCLLRKAVAVRHRIVGFSSQRRVCCASHGRTAPSFAPTALRRSRSAVR
jgi:hypothetical protein